MTNELRILMYTVYLPRQTDGASRSAHALVEAIGRHGVDVQLCTTDFAWTPLEAEAARRARLPIFHALGGHPLELSPGLASYLAAQVGRMDVVHFRGIFSICTAWGAALCRLKGIPYLISPLGNIVPSWKDRKSVNSGIFKFAYYHLIASRLVRAAYRVVCASVTEKQQWESLIDPRKLLVIPNGVGEQDFQPGSQLSEVLTRLGIPGKRYFLFLGYLSWVKGLDFLLRVWDRFSKAHPETVLVVAGGSDLDPAYGAQLRLSARTAGLPGSVIFPGPVSGEFKRGLLQNAIAVLLPSVRESFGNVVLESLAAGTPVLASQATPWSGLESGRVGRWIPASEEAWGIAMHDQASAQDPAGAERCRSWARDNFSWDSVALKYISLYEDAAARRPTEERS